MRDIETLLARIDERTMSILEKLETHDAIHRDIETRVRKIEQFRYIVIGAATILSTGIGGLLSFIKEKL